MAKGRPYRGRKNTGPHFQLWWEYKNWNVFEIANLFHPSIVKSPSSYNTLSILLLLSSSQPPASTRKTPRPSKALAFLAVCPSIRRRVGRWWTSFSRWCQIPLRLISFLGCTGAVTLLLKLNTVESMFGGLSPSGTLFLASSYFLPTIKNWQVKPLEQFQTLQNFNPSSIQLCQEITRKSSFSNILSVDL